MDINECDHKEVVFEYKRKIMNGYVSASNFSDSKKYIQIDSTWFEVSKMKILDTYIEHCTKKDAETESRPETNSRDEKEEQIKIKITPELKDSTILYRICEEGLDGDQRGRARERGSSRWESTIHKGVVTGISPNEFYIAIDDRWIFCEVILLLDILENKLESKKNKFQTMNHQQN